MATVLDFDKPLKFVGQWWLPGKEDKKIIGVLDYAADDGLLLSLEHYFDENEFDVIVGQASGFKVTLLSCFYTTVITPLHEIATYVPTEIFANKAVIGLHVDSEENLEFEKVILETTDIKGWSCLSGIDNREFLKCFREGDGKSFVLPYSFPDSELFFTDDNIELWLSASLNIPPLMPPPTEIVFTEKNYFTLVNKTGDKGFFFTEYFDALLKFIALSMRKNIAVKSLKARPKGLEHDVYILYMPMDIDMDYVSENPAMQEMFFNYPSFLGKIPALFNSWLQGYDEMLPVYNLYFSKNKGMLHNVFLPKAQALEEYHRRLNPAKMSFRERILALYDTFAEVMKHTGDRDAFAQYVLDHRDYYVHWFLKKEMKVFRGINVDYLSRDVNLLLEMCLLAKTGLTVAEIVGLVEGCATYRAYLDIGRPAGDNVFPPPRVKWVPGMLDGQV